MTRQIVRINQDDKNTKHLTISVIVNPDQDIADWGEIFNMLLHNVAEAYVKAIELKHNEKLDIKELKASLFSSFCFDMCLASVHCVTLEENVIRPKKDEEGLVN